MTTINIGTSQGNITNVEFDKPFNEIGYNEVREIARQKYPKGRLSIIGWAPSKSK